LPEGAHDKQRMYLQERVKPQKMTSKEWWLRLQTLSRQRLVYFFPTMEDLKLEYPTATFPDWWKIGELTEADKKRIVITNAP
jgi:hypothetical protein